MIVVLLIVHGLLAVTLLGAVTCASVDGPGRWSPHRPDGSLNRMNRDRRSTRWNDPPNSNRSPHTL